VVITAASVQERQAARPLLWNTRRACRHVRLVWADAASPRGGPSNPRQFGRMNLRTAHSRAVSLERAATEGTGGWARHTHVRYDQYRNNVASAMPVTRATL
jgi:hypothetical protein